MGDIRSRRTRGAMPVGAAAGSYPATEIRINGIGTRHGSTRRSTGGSETWIISERLFRQSRLESSCRRSRSTRVTRAARGGNPGILPFRWYESNPAAATLDGKPAEVQAGGRQGRDSAIARTAAKK